MTRLLAAGLLLLVPSLALAQHGRPDEAKKVAQEVLDRGSALFDKHDAEIMANTFAEDARLTITHKGQDSDELQVQVKDGRDEIKSYYAEIFQNQDPNIKSRNTVQFARFAQPNLLLIMGHFNPNIEQDLDVTFIQVRQKDGDSWRVLNMQIFLPL